jgi:hypothetical protein
MNKILFAIFSTLHIALSLVIAVSSMAAQVTKTLNASWTFPVAEESTITGFRVFNQDKVVVLDNIAPNLRSFSAPLTYDDTVVQAFFMVGLGKDGNVSGPSNILTVKPPFKPLTGVGTFTIELKP